MIMALREWWTKFLNVIGLYTKGQYVNLETVNINLLSRLDLMEETYETQINQLNEAAANAQNTQNNVIAKLNEELAAAKHETVEAKKEADRQVRYTIEKYKAVPDENAALIKELQKQLGDLFREHPVFGFPNSIPIPGSTCVVSHTIRSDDTDDKAICQGRCILTDDITAAINDNPSAEDRFNIITNYMKRYDILARITLELMRHGALGLSLAYNKNCTAYEVYYEVIANVVKDPILTIDTDSRVVDE